ncbi:hypothetical protein [Rheinheimera sp. 4Y26]|uniref:hypothetical protein n=1 Tax=Rheinheimera sp. 4Y26 TaxID=2977811 RepID=UPI0021B0AE5C|nr:hypothetical protein [Rheinheimera sp. 4Y26]MCT6698153.1 hypothetical protein [Rheinheimera sp. 4Y26]
MLFPLATLYAYFRIFVWGPTGDSGIYRMNYFILLAGSVASIYILFDLLALFIKKASCELELQQDFAIIDGKKLSYDEIIIKKKSSGFKICLSYKNNIFWVSGSGYKTENSLENFIADASKLVTVKTEKDSGIL